MSVLNRILSELKQKKVDFEHIEHGFVHRSKEAASIRGNSLSQAAKAIVLKVKDKDSYYFMQAVLQGHRKIHMKTLKKLLSAKNISLASPAEVEEITGCTIGSVPPFGHLFGLEVIADKNLLEESKVVFSAGTHHDSVRLSSVDLFDVLNPKVLSFTVLNDSS